MFSVPAEPRLMGGPVPGGSPDNWQRAAVRRYADLGPLLDELVGRLEVAGFSRKEQFGVRLAVEEAVVNAIKHGHGGDPAKQVRVRYRVGPGRVEAEVEDEGPGFRPEQVPDPLAAENLERPCGRGLLLMRAYMTSVRYNAAGTCVSLCKCREGAPG